MIGGLWLTRRLVLVIVTRRTDDLATRYHWQKATSYVAFVIGLLVVGRIWFEGVGSLATYLGLVSAGIAIALRDLLVNLAGWLFILWRRPFEVGDRIEIGAVAGDVLDVRIFQFTVMEVGNWVAADQSTGRVIHVPNGRVLAEPLANYTQGFQYIWNELAVLVTFESDWQKAKKILQEIVDAHTGQHSERAVEQVKKAARKVMIFYNRLTPIVYTSVQESGVLLTLRYLCHPRRRRGSAEEIWEDILRRFAEHDDIDFAYPTRRFYDNRREGKTGAGGSAPAE